MNVNFVFFLTKNLIALLLLIFIENDFYVSCGPINAKSRHSERGDHSRSFNERRRDIFWSSATISDSSNRGQEIIFRGPSSSQRGKALLPDLDSKGRPTCLSKPEDTFCETVSAYPNVTVKQEIEYSPIEFLEIFGTKDIDGRKSYIDDDLTEERVCKRIPKVIYPQMAKNQANQWVYVVNEIEYTQTVVAEVCEKEGRACNYLERNLPPGMHSRCRQKYSYKRLLALHPTEKRTYSDRFKFPSCCACYVKSNDILSRTLSNRKLTKH